MPQRFALLILLAAATGLTAATFKVYPLAGDDTGRAPSALDKCANQVGCVVEFQPGVFATKPMAVTGIHGQIRGAGTAKTTVGPFSRLGAKYSRRHAVEQSY